MTREEVRDNILAITNRNILAELGTGVGKTRVALDLAYHRVLSKNPTTEVLIVIPRLALINNWQDEIIKWGYKKYLHRFNFVTYVSLPKRLKSSNVWEFLIWDEGHHISERCREAVRGVTIHNNILLSATVNRELKKELSLLFSNLYIYKVSIKQAIESDILPEPKVYLLPLNLDNTNYLYQSKRFGKVIAATQKGYYDNMSNMIEWYKNKYMTTRNERIKTLWLSSAGKRLKWLSEQKEFILMSILKKFKNNRTLTFCSSIAQAELLGKYNITSKNAKALEYLNMFNNKQLDHITAVNMVNEGLNLNDCQICIFGILNSSDTLVIQKMGRALRHKSPVIIIPYYRFTRDEELVKKMLDKYPTESVVTINNINEIVL